MQLHLYMMSKPNLYDIKPGICYNLVLFLFRFYSYFKIAFIFRFVYVLFLC